MCNMALYQELKSLANHTLRISDCTGLLHAVQSLKMTCVQQETCLYNQQSAVRMLPLREIYLTLTWTKDVKVVLDLETY